MIYQIFVIVQKKKPVLKKKLMNNIKYGMKHVFNLVNGKIEIMLVYLLVVKLLKYKKVQKKVKYY